MGVTNPSLQLLAPDRSPTRWENKMLAPLPINTKLTIEENIQFIHKFDVIEFDVEIPAKYFSQSILKR